MFTDSATDLDVPGLIRRIRRECDLSQRDLAAAMGLSPSAVARLETGEVSPRLEVFQRLLRLAGYRLQVLTSRGERARPMRRDAVQDRAGRMLPAHLDPLPYRQLPDIWRFCWQGHERRQAKFGYQHRQARDLRRRNHGMPLDHPDWSVLDPPRQVLNLKPVPECRCPIDCERWCVQECPCQCEPIGLWGCERYEDLPDTG